MDKPKFLNLFQIKFPMTAWVSIAHRVSGILIFLLIGLMIFTLQQSLKSEMHFLKVYSFFKSSWFNLMWFVLLASLIYHSFAGIRHMIMDFGYGESYKAGRLSALIVILSSIIAIGIVGVCLC